MKSIFKKLTIGFVIISAIRKFIHPKKNHIIVDTRIFGSILKKLVIIFIKIFLSNLLCEKTYIFKDFLS